MIASTSLSAKLRVSPLLKWSAVMLGKRWIRMGTKLHKFDEIVTKLLQDEVPDLWTCGFLRITSAYIKHQHSLPVWMMSW